MKVLMFQFPGLETLRLSSLSFFLVSSTQYLKIHHVVAVHRRNLATLTSLWCWRCSWCSKAMGNNGETTAASFVGQRNSWKEEPCWLNLQQLFDKLGEIWYCSQMPRGGTLCDVVLRTFWFLMAFPPSPSNSTCFVLFLHHLTWKRATGLGLEFWASSGKSPDCTECWGSSWYNGGDENLLISLHLSKD